MMTFPRFTKYAFLAVVVPVAVFTLNGCATPAGVVSSTEKEVRTVREFVVSAAKKCKRLSTQTQQAECLDTAFGKVATMAGEDPNLFKADMDKTITLARQVDAKEITKKEAKRKMKPIEANVLRKIKSMETAYVQRKRAEMAQAQQNQKVAKVAGQVLTGAVAAGNAYYAGANQMMAQQNAQMLNMTNPMNRSRSTSPYGSGFNSGTRSSNTTTYFVNTDAGVEQVRCTTRGNAAWCN